MAKKSKITTSGNTTRENTLTNFKHREGVQTSGDQIDRKNQEADMSLSDVSDNVLVSICGLLAGMIGGNKIAASVFGAKGNAIRNKAKEAVKGAEVGLLDSAANISKCIKSINTQFKSVYADMKVIQTASLDWLNLREKAFTNDRVLEFFKNVDNIYNKFVGENNKPGTSGEITFDLKGDNTIIELLEKLQDQEFVNNIPQLSALFDPLNPNGIVSLINALNYVSELINSSEVAQSMQALGLFISNIIQLSTINPEALANSKENAKYIAENVTEQVITIIKGLKDANDLTEKHKTTFIALDAFYKSVMLLGADIPKRKVFVNTLFIRFFIVHSVKMIINALSEAKTLTESAFDNIKYLHNFIYLIKHISYIDKNDRKQIKKNLAYITETYIPSLKDIIKTFLKSISEKDVNEIEKRQQKLAKVFGPGMSDISKEVEKQKPVKESKMNALKGSLAGIGSLVLASGAILILGGLFMKIIDKKDLITFAAILLVFITGVIAAITAPGEENIKSAVGLSENLGYLVLAMGFTLILGSLIMKYVDLEAMMQFLFGYAFIMMVTVGALAYLFQSGEMENAAETINQISYLILIIGFTLVLGSVIMDHVGLRGYFMFLFGYLFIMFVTVTGLWVLRQMMDGANTARTMLAISVLILAIGFTLVLGSLIMEYVSLGAMLKFLLGYTVMLIITVGALWVLKQIMDGSHVWHTLLAISLLVIAVGFTLALGSLIMEIVSLGSLAMFLIGYGVIMFSLVKFLQWINKRGQVNFSINTAAALAILLVAVAGTLFIGAITMKIVDIWELLGFVGAYALTMFALVGFLWTFDKLKITKPSLVQADALALIMIATAETLLIGAIVMKIVDIGDLYAFVGAYALTMFALAGFLWMFDKLKITKPALKQAEALALIMIATAETLLVGSIVMKIVSIEELYSFVGAYALTMFALAGFLWIMDKLHMTKPAIKTSQSLAIVMFAVAGTLFIGALVMKIVDIGELFEFIGAYAVTMFALLGFLFVVKLLGLSKTGIKEAGGIAIIMLAVAGSLLIGAFAMRIVDIWSLLAFIGVYVVTVLLLGTFLCVISPAVPVALGASWEVAGMFAGLVAGMLVLSIGSLLIKSEKIMPFVDVYLSVTGNIMLAMSLLAVLYIPAMIGAVAAVAVYASVMVGAMALYTLSNVKVNDKQIYKLIDVMYKITDKVVGFAKYAFVLPAIMTSLISLGEVIRSIAESVKDYASLKVPVYEGRKIKEYRVLVDEDFKSAARNVSRIITTLGGAVIKTYEKNPQMFETNLFGNSPFGKVCRALKNLGPMIAEIAEGVRDYAALNITDEWVMKDGRLVPKSKRLMTDNDFKGAVKNIMLILGTLGQAVIKAYEEHPEYYQSSLFGNSAFTKVTKAFGNLGPMISKIAEGVRDYAALNITDEWVMKDGKLVPKSKRLMTDSDFNNAVKNIQLILDTLGKSVIKAYEEHPEYYEDSMFSDSIFAKVTKSLSSLGPMISEIAAGVCDYAALNIVDEWVMHEGKLVPKHRRLLIDDDFKNAAKNIKKILNTLGKAVIDAYEEHPDYYNEGWFSDAPFTMVTEAFGKLGPMISNIAEGVRDYAALNIVEEWVMKGDKLVPKSKRLMKDDDFKSASANIQLILNTLGKAIIEFAKKNPDYFGENGDYGDKFKRIIGPITKIGDVITGIANGVLKMAQGKVEIYDEKTGKVKSYEHLGKKHFELASEQITNIVTNLGATLISIYKLHPEMFDDDEDSTFNIIVKSVSNMGEMISNIASGIQSYAKLQFPVYKPGSTEIQTYEKLDSDKIKNAAQNIGSVAATLATSIYYLYEGKYWDPVNNKAEYIPGIDSTQIKKMFNGDDDSIFNIVVRAVSGMGEMIKNIAEGLQGYADLKFPVYKPGSTEVDTYKPLDNDTFKEASKNIGMTVGILGKTIIALYTGQIYDPDKDTTSPNPTLNRTMAAYMFQDPSLWDKITTGNVDNPFVRVVKSVMTLGEMITNIATGIQAFANKKFVSKYDENGKPVEYKPLYDSDFTKATKTISDIITCIGEAIVSIYTMNPKMFDPPSFELGFGKLNSGDFFNTTKGIANSVFDCSIFSLNIPTVASDVSPYERVVSSIAILANVLNSIGNTVLVFANSIIGTEVDSSGHFTKYKIMKKEDYKDAADNIEEILIAIGRSVFRTYDENKKFFMFDSTIETIAKAIGTVGGVVENAANAIKLYSEWKMPIFDKNGKMTKDYRKVTDDDMKDARTAIEDVLLSVGQVIIDVSKNEVIKNNKEAFTSIGTVYAQIVQTLPNIATALQMFATMKAPVYKDGKIVDYVDISPDKITAAKTQIGEVLKAIGGAIRECVENNPNDFGLNAQQVQSGAVWSAKAIEDPKSNKIVQMATAISLMGDPLVKIAESLKYYSLGTFKDSDGNRITVNATEMDNAKIKIREVLIAVVDAIWAAYSTKRELFNEDVIENISNGIETYSDSIATIATNVKTIVDTLGLNKVEEYMTALNSIASGYMTAIKTLNGVGDLGGSLVTANLENEINNQVKADTNKWSSMAAWNNNSIQIQQTAKIPYTADVESTIEASVSISEKTKTIIEYVQALKEVVNVAEEAETTGSEGYTILSTGIDQVNTSVSKVKSNEIFKQHQETLRKYITVINSIDQTKMNSLTLLTLSTTMLANKMGNLDNLTKAIANELATALEHLSKKLDEAKETINKAEEIQKRRHKLIDDSVKQVQKVMSQKLSIEIHKVSDTSSLAGSPDTSTSTGAPSPTSSTDTSSSSSSSSTGTSVQTDPKATPFYNADAQPGSNTFNMYTDTVNKNEISGSGTKKLRDDLNSLISHYNAHMHSYHGK